MKKLLINLIIVALILPALARAQVEQGKVAMGLSSRIGLTSLFGSTSTDLFSVGFSNVTSDYRIDQNATKEKSKINTFNLQPRLGYLINDNLALGVDLSYAHLMIESEEDHSKITSNTIGAGPFIRYYFHTEKVIPFLELNSLFGATMYKYEYPEFEDSESKESITSIGGGLGVALPLGRSASFDAMFGYNSYQTKEKDVENYESTVTRGTFGFRMGFTVYLGKNN